MLGDAIECTTHIVEPRHLQHHVDAAAGLGHLGQSQAVLARIAMHEVDARPVLGRELCMQDVGEAESAYIGPELE
ncbi:hypothetical protein D3C84_1153270 [compost metagenome]